MRPDAEAALLKIDDERRAEVLAELGRAAEMRQLARTLRATLDDHDRRSATAAEFMDIDAVAEELDGRADRLRIAIWSAGLAPGDDDAMAQLREAKRDLVEWLPVGAHCLGIDMPGSSA